MSKTLPSLQWLALSGLLIGSLGIAALAQPAGPASAVSAVPFERAMATRVVEKLAAKLEKTFLYPDIGRAYGAMLRQKLAAGEYGAFSDATAFAARVTADLQAVAPDGHLRLFAPGAGGHGQAPAPGSAPLPPAMEQAEWIAPGIAYVRFNIFTGRPEIVEAFTAFLDSHSDARVLIIDARTHRGGGLREIDVLFPRIFSEPRTVMMMDTRASVAGKDPPFRGTVIVPGTAELARAEHRVRPLTPASPLVNTRIYLLTSPRTASAAEHLASVLKETHRGTLVGGTTTGAGNYGESFDLPGDYSAFIPIGHSYFPGTTGWEGTGVKPDIAVAPERALVETLVREGIPAAEAERLSSSHQPSGSMEKRRPTL